MRWIVRIIGAAGVFVLLGVGALVLIPAEKVAAVAVSKFNSLTGRQLVISGAVRPSIWPQLGVKTGPVSVSNAAWSDQGPMLQAEGLSIAIDMAALIGGSVQITGVEVIAPQIVLERSAAGEENWVFGEASGGTVTAETPGVAAPFTLDRAVISDGSVTYLDHGAGSRVALSGLSGEVAIPDYTGPASLQMAGVMNGQAFETEIGIGAFQAFLDGRLVDLDLTLRAGAADVRLKGRAGWQPLMAEGQLAATLGDLAAISLLAGIARPALPQGLGAGQVDVAAAVTLTPEASVHLRGATLTLDGNVLGAEIDLETAGARPVLTAKVTAGALNLAGIAGEPGTGTATAPGWSREGIDAGGLGALDATVALSADSVDLGAARLGAVQMLATLDRGRAVFDLRRVVAYDGTISGQFVVNARKGLSVGGDLRLAGMSMQAALTDLADYDRLIGTGDLQVKFLGVGPSVDAIMHSLEGAGSLSLGKGELRGLDIAGMIANLDPGYVGAGQKTIFDGITASFAIKGGILTNDDLALQAPLISASGAGAVDLGAQRLDYRLRSTLITGEQQGVSVPLLISGPWSDPKVQLDLESLARENLAEEAAQLEAAAREKAAELEAAARAKLEAELGIVQGEGESLEDAARRRAEEALRDEAAKALGGLLGGN